MILDSGLLFGATLYKQFSIRHQQSDDSRPIGYSWPKK